MPHPYGQADARFFLNTIVPSELTWVIVERSSREVVGAMGLPLHEHPVERAELGYYVTREHWGRGIATEAGSAILAYGIGLLGTDRITSGYFVDNPASGRVLEKLGFRPSGMSERACLAVGAPKPSVEMVLKSGRP